MLMCPLVLIRRVNCANFFYIIIHTANAVFALFGSVVKKSCGSNDPKNPPHPFLDFRKETKYPFSDLKSAFEF